MIEPSRRDDIVTNGIPRSEIPDLIVCEKVDFTKKENLSLLARSTKSTYPAEEVFGEFVNVNGFIEAPLDAVFDYLTNVYAFEEWTVSLRDFRYLGAGIYRGTDRITPKTEIFMKIESYREAGVVDHICAWDQGDELWMRYHFRLLDGMKTVKRPGTVLAWFNAKHEYYATDRAAPAPEYIAKPRARTDRLWVGDLWQHFYSGHLIEFMNLKKILEHRWRHG
jgi:hypothetical protein